MNDFSYSGAASIDSVQLQLKKEKLARVTVSNEIIIRFSVLVIKQLDFAQRIVGTLYRNSRMKLWLYCCNDENAIVLKGKCALC